MCVASWRKSSIIDRDWYVQVRPLYSARDSHDVPLAMLSTLPFTQSLRMSAGMAVFGSPRRAMVVLVSTAAMGLCSVRRDPCYFAEHSLTIRRATLSAACAAIVMGCFKSKGARVTNSSLAGLMRCLPHPTTRCRPLCPDSLPCHVFFEYRPTATTPKSYFMLSSSYVHSKLQYVFSGHLDWFSSIHHQGWCC